MTKKIVIVTGGAGYIGSHCCKTLSEAGFFPVVFDNFSTGHREFVRWGPCVEGDVRDPEAIDNVLQQYLPVAVMHFAASSVVSQSVFDPGAYWSVNTGGTLNLLQSMIKANVKKIIFSSTAAVYGNTNTDNIKENSVLLPINPYGATKLAAETMMDNFDVSNGVKSVRLRYFNAAGADRDCVIGEHHNPETHLIPLVLDCALGRRMSISIFGSDYNTTDGTAVRDYIHVEDLANAHLKALNYLLDGGQTIAVNLGSGFGATVAEVIEVARRITKREVQGVVTERRIGDPPRLVADPTLAARVLGWRTDKSDLETIVLDAWRWHQKRF